ncbi:hypothetical protein [Fusicatenibacter sp.]
MKEGGIVGYGDRKKAKYTAKLPCIRRELPVASPVGGRADCRNDFSNTL